MPLINDTINNNIQSADDLHAAMRQLKTRIQLREQELARRWEQLPRETFKTAAGAVLPAFMGDQVASGIWMVLKAGYGLIKAYGGDSGSKEGEGLKGQLKTGVRQIGFFAALRLVLNLLKTK